jgi:hypothetical protein
MVNKLPEAAKMEVRNEVARGQTGCSPLPRLCLIAAASEIKDRRPGTFAVLGPTQSNNKVLQRWRQRSEMSQGTEYLWRMSRRITILSV